MCRQRGRIAEKNDRVSGPAVLIRVVVREWVFEFRVELPPMAMSRV